VGIEGGIAATREATIIRPYIAQGLVPVGKLCAPGTANITGQSLTSVAQGGVTAGQVIALPSGLVSNPLATSAFVGIPLYDATQVPYDATLGYSAWPNQSEVAVIYRGPVYVAIEPGSTPTTEGDVYVRVAASGSNTVLGAFNSAPGAGLVLLTQGKWQSGIMNILLATGSTGNGAILQLR
jgi:hypothetical protein